MKVWIVVVSLIALGEARASERHQTAIRQCPMVFDDCPSESYFAAVTQPQLTPAALKRAEQKVLLEEGGVLILLNDHEEEPVFNKEQARSVGFEIVRWGVKHPLAPAVRRLMPYDPSHPKASLLSAFILRRGKLKADRMGFDVRTILAPTD